MDNIDNNFLQYFAGMENNSLTNVLKIDIDISDDEIHNEPNIIEDSSYYEFNDLVCPFNNNKKSFSIISTNAQSINAKIYQLRIFVEILKTLGHEFSAICIQESWLTDNCDTSQLQLDGYQMISHVPNGDISFIHMISMIVYTWKNKLNEYGSWEGQVIQIKKTDSLNKGINLVNLYRPPEDVIEKYNEFAWEICPLLKNPWN